MKRFTLVTLAVVPMLLAALTVAAQPESNEQLLRSMQRDLEALKEGQNRVQKDVEDIKALLQRLSRGGRPEEPQIQDIVLTQDGQRKGDAAARLMLVDFTDYQ